MGSLLFHSFTSLCGLYFVASSAVVWSDILYVSISINVGPLPALAFSSAYFAASYIANISLPSTCSPSTPYDIAFCAIVCDAVCFRTGTDIAHLLFWHTKTHGTFSTPATFIAS